MKKLENNALKQRVLERLLFEMFGGVVPYGRNFKTVDNDPYSYKDVPGIQVEEYAGEDGGYWVKIDVDPMPELSTPARLFKSHEDAESFLRKNIEEIKVKLMNRQR
mgnify:CR=1 FL=1